MLGLIIVNLIADLTAHGKGLVSVSLANFGWLLVHIESVTDATGRNDLERSLLESVEGAKRGGFFGLLAESVELLQQSRSIRQTHRIDAAW